jgi:hypothetical protein
MGSLSEDGCDKLSGFHINMLRLFWSHAMNWRLVFLIESGGTPWQHIAVLLHLKYVRWLWIGKLFNFLHHLDTTIFVNNPHILIKIVKKHGNSFIFHRHTFKHHFFRFLYFLNLKWFFYCFVEEQINWQSC